MSLSSWSVGKVAKRCGVKVSTLHFYEQKGLIKSQRNLANQRRYKPDVLRRVAIIKAAQKMGISLAEIKLAFSALPDNRTPSTEDWQLLSSQWRDKLDQRISYLQGLRDSMTSCIGCGCLSMKTCPLYNENDQLGKKGVGAILLEQTPN